MIAPELSYLLFADRVQTVHGVLVALGAQTIADQLEVVLVMPAGSPTPANTYGLGALVTLHEDPPLQTSRARAVAVRAARAPVVTIGESHCFPEPGYAEAVVRAHRVGRTGVGPAILNANPRSTLSWAALVMDYGPWVHAERSGPVDVIAVHNGSFRRAALLAFGAGLEAALEDDMVLAERLARRGAVFALESSARTRHLNVSRPLWWARERAVAGRAYAAARSREWSAFRRVLYALASPLIPLVRLRRHRHDLARACPDRVVMPALVLALLLSAAGEAAGYLAGAGLAARRRRLWEMHKGRLVRSGELEAAVGSASAR